MWVKVRYSSPMVNVGAVVEIVKPGSFARSSGFMNVAFEGGERARVTRVTSAGKLLVAKPGRGNGAAWMTRDAVNVIEDGVPVPDKPKPRPLGQTPEDGEHIAIDDPRIAWIWADAAKAADTAGYCGTYDELADKIGAPGRERDFNVTVKINGMDGVFTVRAKSKPLAAAAIMEKFPQAKVTANQDTGRRHR